MDRREPVALRIVVDGAEGAGKTTTARALGAKLGQPVVSPEEADGRTLLFDWMEYVGGRHDGAAIRTQLVTVPGHLAERRAALLQTADVVLFVADTSASRLAATAAAHRELLEQLAGRARPPAVLIAANKRDTEDAVPLRVLRSALGLEAGTNIVECVATDGEGVRQAFVYSVRLALPALRHAPKDRPVETDATPSDVEAYLRALEADHDPAGPGSHARPTEVMPDPFPFGHDRPSPPPEPSGVEVRRAP